MQITAKSRCFSVVTSSNRMPYRGEAADTGFQMPGGEYLIEFILTGRLVSSWHGGPPNSVTKELLERKLPSGQAHYKTKEAEWRWCAFTSICERISGRSPP
jgi:hypothetical protein